MDWITEHKEQVQLMLTLLILTPVLLGQLLDATEPEDWTVPMRSAGSSLGDIRGGEDVFIDQNLEFYWRSSKHDPFRFSNNQRPLPPPELSLPPLPGLVPLRLPITPLPDASACYWLTLPLVPGVPEGVEALASPVPSISGQPGLSIPMATGLPSLQDQVRLHDVIELVDGRRLEGTLLQVEDDKVYFRNVQGSVQRSFERSEVSRIERVRSLENVYLDHLESLRTRGGSALLELARECREHQDLRSVAVLSYQAFLAKRPGASRVRIELSNLNRFLGNLDHALGILNEGLSLRNEDPGLLAARAAILETPALGTKAWALRDRGKVASKNKDHLIELARSQLVAGETESAYRILQRISKGGGLDLPGRTFFLEALLVTGRVNEAVELGTELASSEEAGVRVYELLGGAFYLRGQLEAARVLYEKALSSASESEAGPIQYSLGVTLFGLKKYDDAVIALEEASVRMSLDSCLPFLGLAALEEKKSEMDPAEVEALYADALFSNPTNAFADYFFANYQWRMAGGDSASPYHQKAKDSYESALRKDFGLTDCMSRLGVLAMESGQMDSAIRFFRTSIARRATAGKYAQLARVYLVSARKISEGNFRTPLRVHARTCYERASSLDPTFLGAPLGFGYLESLKGNLIEAEEQFRDAEERYQEQMASVTDVSTRDLLTARSREFLDHAKTCRTSIRDNLSKWQWFDVFARSDDMNIYRKWQEKEDRGVQVRIENQQAVFQGISSIDYGITLMAQATHAEEFVEFRATLDLSEAGDCWAGIGLFSGRKNEGLSGLYFGRSWKGKLVVASVTGESLPEWTILGNWAVGDPVQIAIRSTSKRRYYDLLLNGEVVARDVRVQVPFSGGGFRVGIFGMARRNRSYRMAASEARFIFRRREQ